MAQVRIWHIYIVLATAITVCLAIRCCNGAPFYEKGSLSRERRGIFGQLTSVTTTTTATPRFKFGTTKRFTATKKVATTSKAATTTVKSTSELNEISTVSKMPESIAFPRKESTEEVDEIFPVTSTSTESPEHINSSPSALVSHREESSEKPIVFPDYENGPESPALRHSFPPKKEKVEKEKTPDEPSNNRALSPSSIWNLIVVLLQLAYTVTQQKIPP